MADVEFTRSGRLARILLNRPAALNALSLEMLAEMEDHLLAWADDPAVGLVLVEGAGGKAFAAGGDIQRLYDEGRAGGRYPGVFFWNEYIVDRRIHRYAKPYVAFLDGIVMGGGVGLSVLGSHRVATEKTQFAMPETGIGFFPDVGGTWFLPRLPGRLGLWLALTGERLGGADALGAGVATHYVPSARLDGLREALAADGIAALDRFAEQPEPGPIAALRPRIDRLFAGDSVQAILAALDAEGDEWAARTAKTIRTKSPTSLAVAFEQLRRGGALSLEEALTFEYRLSQAFMAHGDFLEGVRALIVDKDRNPRWGAPGDPAAMFDTPAPGGDLVFGDPQRRAL